MVILELLFRVGSLIITLSCSFIYYISKLTAVLLTHIYYHINMYNQNTLISLRQILWDNSKIQQTLKSKTQNNWSYYYTNTSLNRINSIKAEDILNLFYYIIILLQYNAFSFFQCQISNHLIATLGIKKILKVKIAKVMIFCQSLPSLNTHFLYSANDLYSLLTSFGLLHPFLLPYSRRFCRCTPRPSSGDILSYTSYIYLVFHLILFIIIF